MLILPFTHNIVNQNNINIHVIKLLTIGGKTIWEEEDSLNIDTDILNSNDIYRKGNLIKMKKKLHLCEVDLNKTNMNDFYNWNEIAVNDNNTFCWRNYIQFLDNNTHSWLNIPQTEKLGNVSISEIIQTIIQNKK
jgi:hypothetical protein